MRLFRSQPRIALAGAAEAAAIAELYSRAWAGLRGKLDERLIADQTPGSEEVAAWLKGGFEVFTAALDGDLVGVVRCSFPTGTCLVDRMAVDPDRNGNGIGRVLAEHAIARARRAGVTKVWVQATPKLEEVVNLYRSLGFRESAHLRAHYWGEDVTLMELPLLTPVIRTERLVVRSAAETDVAALVRFFDENREHMAPWEPPRPPDFHTAEFWRVQVGRHRRAFESGAAVMLFLFPKDQPGDVIGQISYTSIVRGPADMCMLGYALAESAQGNGYMHEALLATNEYVFKQLNMHRVMANFMPHNTRSNAVLRRLGFTVEGYARDYLFVNGAWRDHVLTSLTNHDWKPLD